MKLVLPFNYSQSAITNFALFKMPAAPEDDIPSSESFYTRTVHQFLESRLNSTANWLIDNQATDGSWKVSARREFTKSIALPFGWCSAMGQGE